MLTFFYPSLIFCFQEYTTTIMKSLILVSCLLVIFLNFASSEQIQSQEIVCVNDNEVLPPCVPCAETCDDKKAGMACAAICTTPTRCYCAAGFYYDDNKKCVPEASCN